jgi:hypothetical protein
MTKNSHAINETRHSTKADGKETAGFVPTRDELVELVKYWVTKAIDDNYFIFWGQCFSGSDLWRMEFDWQRVNEIAQILGKEETGKAVKKAYEKAAQACERCDWIVFRYGTQKDCIQDMGGQGRAPAGSGLREMSRTACRSSSRSASIAMRLTLSRSIDASQLSWPLAAKSAMFWNKV